MSTETVAWPVFEAPLVSRELVQVKNAGECSRVSNGWYYDNATLPTKILICEAACNNFGAGSFQIVLGCQTRVPL